MARFAPADEDEAEDAPLVGADDVGAARQAARDRHKEPTIWFDDTPSNFKYLLLLSLSLGLGMLTGFHGFHGLFRLASELRCWWTPTWRPGAGPAAGGSTGSCTHEG